MENRKVNEKSNSQSYVQSFKRSIFLFKMKNMNWNENFRNVKPQTCLFKKE